MIIYLLSFIIRIILQENTYLTEFGYAAPPDWFSIPFIVVWLVKFLILFFLYKRYRIRKRLAWSKVIQIYVLTDLLYLVVGYLLLSTLMYVLAAIQVCIALLDCSFFQFYYQEACECVSTLSIRLKVNFFRARTSAIQALTTMNC